MTKGLNLEKAGVEVTDKGKIDCPNNDEQTNVPNIYAIGDVLHGKIELTPTAIKAGNLLAKRLYAGGTELMDYTGVPTCVFTPLEYGACGYSEEDAQKAFGEENVDVYHTKFKPLEWMYCKESHGGKRTCYVKVIVHNKEGWVAPSLPLHPPSRPVN